MHHSPQKNELYTFWWACEHFRGKVHGSNFAFACSVSHKLVCGHVKALAELPPTIQTQMWSFDLFCRSALHARPQLCRNFILEILRGQISPTPENTLLGVGGCERGGAYKNPAAGGFKIYTPLPLKNAFCSKMPGERGGYTIFPRNAASKLRDFG